MSSSTKRSTSVLLSLLFLVGALAVYANFVRPEFKEVQQLRAMLAAKTQLLENQKTELIYLLKNNCQFYRKD